MRAPLRHAIAVLRASGFEVDRIYEAGRHTEIHFLDSNGGGLVRVHRGNRVSPEFERALRSIIRKHRRGRQVMRLDLVLNALRRGAVLRFSLGEKPRWDLYETDGAVTAVSSVQAQSLLRRGVIEAAGDTLLAEVPSQTWRYAKPIGGAS
jgi:hypothetical protein